MNSKEIETFIQDVRDDISNNLEGSLVIMDF